MPSQSGLLRRLLGPASSHVVGYGARHVPRSPLVAAPTEDDISGQQFAAMIHAVWLIFVADDMINEDEIDHLLRIIDDLTEGEAPSEAIEELFDTYATLFAEIGALGSAALIADILDEPELRESTLKLAVGAVSLNSTMTEEEERTLMLLATAFGYNSQQTQAVFDEVEANLYASGLTSQRGI